MPELIDTDSLSLEELRKLAIAELNGETPTATASASATPAANATPDEEEAEDAEGEGQEEAPAKKLYRRVVDIGDGVEPEVFEADTLEGLVDKIADAKAHATRKIREQGEQLRKSKAAETPKPRAFTEDEEYVFSQELLNKPTIAFQKMFKELVGMDITQFKTVAEKTTALEAAANKNNAISTFLTTHPLYEDNQRNTDLMTLAMQGKEVTAENLSKAYQSLVAKGLLVTDGEKQSSEQDKDSQAKSAIQTEAVKPSSPLGTKKSSSLRSGNSVPRVSSQPSEDELYKMPLDKLRELANNSLRSR